MNNAAPADLWFTYRGKLSHDGRAITAWSSVGLSAPSPDLGGAARIKVVCGDCGGSGFLEEEYAASSASLEPSVRHSECDHCDSEGVYATDIECEEGTAFWNDLMNRYEIPAAVWRAAVIESLADQLECDEKIAWHERDRFLRENGSLAMVERDATEAAQ